MVRNGPRIQDVPIGLDATGTRTESDSLGEIEVPADHYWGAQTQRSLIHFSIGDDRMPKAVYHAYGYIKKAAAHVNGRAGRLPRWKADLIARVADEVIDGRLDPEFPLYVWQTGSGTQSNMNVNEVISNRAIQLLGGRLGSKDPVHPNDHVNMGQSSNDTFVTAMHIAVVQALETRLLPALSRLADAAGRKSREWAHVVKVGRTHLEDATPLTVGQEWSGYVAQIEDATEHLKTTARGLDRLAIGGTAVGTGLNAPPGFGDEVAREIARLTRHAFTGAPNRFAAQASCDPLVRVSAALRALAVSLFKFANDMRWLGSGPRTGLHELDLPSNEPGSSIMPGKVNPTQAEAMLMVAVQVIADDGAVSMAGAEGNFELNAFRPLIINNVLHSIRILSDMIDHFREYLVEGVRLNTSKLESDVERSVMMVTALSPVIGYDESARIAHRAIADDLTLKEAAMRSGVDERLFDRVVDPERLTRPGVAGDGRSRRRTGG
ncbi:class II fumarate hydratase [Planotetraspora kaengkrachanensis]|uniref:Fumarate hydratase class II n=1 Tax=Planotetraspora kaengkrachanensis TaxID=575193 RepID=A0A8J3LXM8_9ACTN|nr:class II fumarate hydratase [Planotetraspora kaengkrachanensis]GIG80437.1 class II fumarate hydratase [Planotetraspora kaengkrachanensis]